MARSEELLSHWHLLINDLNTSTLDFYAAIEEGLEARAIPAFKTKRIFRKEGGLLSAKREYLRVIRDRLTFDICAAPYGTSFFLSWWLVGHQFRLGTVLNLLLIALVPFTHWIMPRMLFEQAATIKATAAVAVGVIFLLYLQWFRPRTYYTVDTRLMFQESVHRATLDAIESIQTTRGLRALSPEEMKPTLRDLLR